MGVFEFIIVLVMVSTIGKVVTDRYETRMLANNRSREAGPDLQALVDTVEDMNDRLARVEEERDFYKRLLDAPDKKDDPERPDMLPR